MSGYSHILVGYPSETGHSKILEDGLSFAKIMDASVDVVHIAECLSGAASSQETEGGVRTIRLPSGATEYVCYSESEEEEEVREQREAFKKTLQTYEKAVGVTAGLKALGGDPAETVVDMSPDYSLVVIGSGKESKKGKRLLGPMARNVIRFSESPVLVLREWNRKKKVKSIQNILVPVDGSDISNFAAAHAALIANKVFGTITLLNIWEKRDEKLLGKMKIKKGNLNLSDLKSQICRDALDDAKKTMITRKKIVEKVIDGEAGETIITESENHDLVVMGTWGKGGIKKFLLGDTAESVAQHAHCPVLLVRGVQE